MTPEKQETEVFAAKGNDEKDKIGELPDGDGIFIGKNAELTPDGKLLLCRFAVATKLIDDVKRLLSAFGYDVAEAKLDAAISTLFDARNTLDEWLVKAEEKSGEE